MLEAAEQDFAAFVGRAVRASFVRFAEHATSEDDGVEVVQLAQGAGERERIDGLVGGAFEGPNVLPEWLAEYLEAEELCRLSLASMF